MNRNILITISGAALLSFGLLTGVTNNNEVSAAVQVGQSNRLERNAYIYNSQGRRTKKNVWKHGKKVLVLGTKTIKGKKYARIGRNQYIRLTNFKKYNTSSKPTALLKHNAYVFDENGRRIKVASLKKNKIVTILGTRYIKGKKYYQIAKNRFIKAANATTSIANEVNNSRNDLNQKSTANNTNTTTVINNNSTSVNSNVDNNAVTGVTNTVNGSTVSSNVTSSSTVSANSNTNSSTTSEKSTDIKNNDTDGNSSDLEKGLKVLHTSYVFDKAGKHILGSFVIKGSIVYVKNATLINGKQYYGLVGDDDDSITGYVPATAFDKNATGLKVTVSDKSFIQYKKDIDQLSSGIFNSFAYDLSSPAKKNAYRAAYSAAYEVGNFKYSTVEDMEAAKANLKQAIKDLDGKPVVVEGTYDNYILTSTQKSQILALVNKKYNVTDARFDPDGKYVIYTQDAQRKTTDIRPFIRFENKASFNPLQYMGNQVVKHNSFVYNDKGQRELGEFVSKGDKVRVSSYTKINGQIYYSFYNINGSDVYPTSDKFLPVSVFEENGKDEKFEPASKKEFDDFTKFLRNMNGQVYDHDIYELSSPTDRANYQKASEIGGRVANDDRSSQADIEIVEKQMKAAFAKLNGKKIQIEGKRKDHKYTKEEIEQILDLIARSRGIKNIKYVGISNDTIEYVVNHKNEQADTRFFVHFSDDNSWN
ncbi:SLAP domain-containing protein [Lactobacillus amylovorus]|uniref:SLAP domain-containing protein n=1 Tax=Lactobacillus amylovorus TaxID=1604 RepID=UPI00232EE14F|nr:SLAP domain-containing protein [Lactobacillus amylovorus]MDB6221688.1 SLAP domain-containing protein [Lactobacillus amylovorus]